MNVEQKKARKTAKARQRRRDFIRKRNINKNVPTQEHYERVDRFRTVFTAAFGKGWPRRLVKKQVFNADGTPKLEAAGRKTVTKKRKLYRHKDISNPDKPRKDAAQREVGMVFYKLPERLKQKANT